MWKDTQSVALLDSIHGPADVKLVSPSDLPKLAQEIRDFLVESVSRSGGHLGPNPVSYTHLTLPTSDLV